VLEFKFKGCLNFVILIITILQYLLQYYVLIITILQYCNKKIVVLVKKVTAVAFNKDDKPDFLAKYSSNQNEPKNKVIDNEIIDIFAVDEIPPASSGEELDDKTKL